MVVSNVEQPLVQATGLSCGTNAGRLPISCMIFDRCLRPCRLSREVRSELVHLTLRVPNRGCFSICPFHVFCDTHVDWSSPGLLSWMAWRSQSYRTKSKSKLNRNLVRWRASGGTTPGRLRDKSWHQPRPLPSLTASKVPRLYSYYLYHFFKYVAEHFKTKKFGSGERLQLVLHTKVNFALLSDSFEACDTFTSSVDYTRYRMVVIMLSRWS